jgi:hypothetical protein
MTTYIYWIPEGDTPREVDFDEYVKWAQEPFEKTRRIAKTKIGRVEVSTVFLTIDHNWAGGPPILFETMIFGGPHDESQWRYHTRAEAEAGHARVVAALRRGEDPEATA